MPEAGSDWSRTVLLPKTEFPMRGDLARREPLILERWRSLGEGRGLYALLRERQAGRPEFLLHDGPPYANGAIHIGHALNKILKDVTVKSRALMGFSTPYRPGWDCHGLPIETALLKEKKTSKRSVSDIPAFRREAAAFARRFIELQRADFERLGVLGEWGAPYTTMAPAYEGAILRAFAELLKKGLAYRGLKPTLWCVTCETALAEAEVEYKDKRSPSIYVALPLLERGAGDALRETGEEAVVWTTTPWTLPANLAVAYHSKLRYVCAEVRAGGRTRRLVLAEARLPDLLKELSGELAGPPRAFDASRILYRLPFGEATGAGLAAEHVTAEDGTGLVHTAPGHGEDDFRAGKAAGLEPLNPVDGSGRFSEKAPERLRGLKIFEEGNPAVVRELRERGLLLAEKSIEHSYPHCWRCKNPVVFRATEQWFLGLTPELRARLLSLVEGVRWLPPQAKGRIAAMIESRPDWCLSRQRVWGAPIPVLYSSATGRPVLDAAVLDAVAAKAEAEGADFWFERWGAELKPADWPFLPPHPDLAGGFRRETDILDVWLDSGVSWLAVLGPEAQADLYLEGSDQHRGWFQSSLVMSAALRGRSPYKAVMTHGFVLDEAGRAMHKSAGNAVAPQDEVSKRGADVLRLWAVLSDYAEDVRISEKLMEVPSEAYRRVRNTLRFLLGNLDGYDGARPAELPSLERFVLHRLAVFQEAMLDDYRGFRYRQAARRLTDYCSAELSAGFLDVVKDRLYTFPREHPARRAAQHAALESFRRVCALAAPILSFTAEEAWGFLPEKLRPGPGGRPVESVFLWDLPAAEGLRADERTVSLWSRVQEARPVVWKAIEEARAAKLLGSSNQAAVLLRGPASFLEGLEGLDLAEAFIVSAVRLEPGAPSPSACVSAAPGAKCARCWRWQGDVGVRAASPDLCGRCASQLS